MIIYRTAPTLFFAFLVQTAFLTSLYPAGLRPDLLLLFVIGIGVIGGVGRAVAWGLVCGLLLDVASAAPLGANMVALLPVAFLTALRDTDMIQGKLTLATALAFAGTLVYACVFLLIVQATGRRVEWLVSLGWIALPVAVLNTVLMPAVYWITRRLAQPQLVNGATFAGT